MKTIKKAILFLFIISVITIMSSCMTTKTCVGTYTESPGSTYTFAKGKQIWLFWGILPVGRTNVATPTNGSCQVITRFNFVDFIISGLTAGIITTETIKIVAKN
jgi:hypothetical protein